MRKPVIPEFIGRDSLGLQQRIQGRCIVPEPCIATSNVDQKTSATFVKLAWHPLKVYLWNMLHRFRCVTQFNSNGHLMDRHIRWTKHGAKVRPLFGEFAAADSCCFQRCMCLTAITSASQGGSSAEQCSAAQT